VRQAILVVGNSSAATAAAAPTGGKYEDLRLPYSSAPFLNSNLSRPHALCLTADPLAKAAEVVTMF
jgi:hypothetical protein